MPSGNHKMVLNWFFPDFYGILRSFASAPAERSLPERFLTRRAPPDYKIPCGARHESATRPRSSIPPPHKKGRNREQDRTKGNGKPVPDPTASPLWEFVSPSEFTPPPATITDAVKGGVKGLWQRLKPTLPALPNPVKTHETIHRLAGDLIECAAAPPDWTAAAAPLGAPWSASAFPETETGAARC
jgi:hypothetical protein